MTVPQQYAVENIDVDLTMANPTLPKQMQPVFEQEEALPPK